MADNPIVGSARFVELTVLNADGNPDDPATQSIVVRRPNGTTYSPTINTVGVGVRNVLIEFTAAGVWRYRWETTDPIVVMEGSITVDPSAVL